MSRSNDVFNNSYCPWINLRYKIIYSWFIDDVDSSVPCLKYYNPHSKIINKHIKIHCIYLTILTQTPHHGFIHLWRELNVLNSLCTSNCCHIREKNKLMTPLCKIVNIHCLNFLFRISIFSCLYDITLVLKHTDNLYCMYLCFLFCLPC